mmetsp:Transcript_34349/g.85127  ORF Transcript_34349/g.85127 Transcript_34349/m.85127 type:complete len:214 (+) Transcript_34349:49-690(+)
MDAMCDALNVRTVRHNVSHSTIPWNTHRNTYSIHPASCTLILPPLVSRYAGCAASSSLPTSSWNHSCTSLSLPCCICLTVSCTGRMSLFCTSSSRISPTLGCQSSLNAVSSSSTMPMSASSGWLSRASFVGRSSGAIRGAFWRMMSISSSRERVDTISRLLLLSCGSGQSSSHSSRLRSASSISSSFCCGSSSSTVRRGCVASMASMSSSSSP